MAASERTQSDAPPTYEESLHHPRLTTGLTMLPEYTEQYEDPFQARFPHYHHQRQHQRTSRSSPYDTFAYVPSSNLQGGSRSRGQVWYNALEWILCNK